MNPEPVSACFVEEDNTGSHREAKISGLDLKGEKEKGEKKV